MAKNKAEKVTLVRGDKRKTATNPADIVAAKFDGWQVEKARGRTAPAPAAPAPAAATDKK